MPVCQPATESATLPVAQELCGHPCLLHGQTHMLFFSCSCSGFSAVITGASGDVDVEDSDIEWMDSEPLPASQPLSKQPIATASGSGALKPPLPPALSGSRGLLLQRQSSAAVTNPLSTTGRHQSAAVSDSASGDESPHGTGVPRGRVQLPSALLPGPSQQHGNPKTGQPPTEPSTASHQDFSFMQSLLAKPGSVLPSQKIQTADKAAPQSTGQQSAELPKSPSTHNGDASQLQSQDQAPAESPVKQTLEQPTAPITSPFKKVPSPWEKGKQQQPAHQASPSADPKGKQQQPAQQSGPSTGLKGKSALGKRKLRPEDALDSSPSEKAIESLQHVMAEADDTAKDQTRDSVLLDMLEDVPDDMPMPVSVEDRGLGMGQRSNGNLKSTSRQPLETSAQVKGTGDRRPLQQATPQQQQQQQQQQSANAPAKPAQAQPAAVAAADAADAAAAFDKQHQLAASQASAGSARLGDQQQHQLQAPLATQQRQPSKQQQQQQPYSSNAIGAVDSVGASGSLPAPSEVGLGEYGSAALDPGMSGGVSGGLPSFDLDAEIATLDKQNKVCNTMQRDWLSLSRTSCIPCLLLVAHHSGLVLTLESSSYVC